MEERISEFKELMAGAAVKGSGRKKNPDTDQAKAQRYLEGCREGRNRAEFLENQIKELEAVSQYSSPSFTGLGGSSNSSNASDKVGVMAAKIADLKTVLEQERTKCLEERAKALILICGLSDCRLAEVLTQRYIKDKSWCVISSEMHIAETWLYKLHTKALKAFWEMYGDSIEKNERLI